MKSFLLLTPLLLIFFFFIFTRTVSDNHKEGGKVINVGKVKITVKVADNEGERSQGLSGRTSLAQDQGMLFVFPQKYPYSFWMKDMKFPLDFVWIDGNKIAEITYSVPHPKENETPITLKPQVSIDKVLEVNAGVVEKSGIKVGDIIKSL